MLFFLIYGPLDPLTEYLGHIHTTTITIIRHFKMTVITLRQEEFWWETLRYFCLLIELYILDMESRLVAGYNSSLSIICPGVEVNFDQFAMGKLCHLCTGACKMSFSSLLSTAKSKPLAADQNNPHWVLFTSICRLVFLISYRRVGLGIFDTTILFPSYKIKLYKAVNVLNWIVLFCFNLQYSPQYSI